MEKRVEGQDLLNIASEMKLVTGEAEKKGIMDAIRISCIITVVLSLLMTFMEIFICHRWNFGMLTTFMTFSGVLELVVGKKNKEKKESIIGIVEIVIAVFFFILFMGALFV